jgi:ribosomal protein L11 methyltransferase
MSSWKITIESCDVGHAGSICGALTEILVPAPDAVTQFDQGAGWRIEAYFAGAPDMAAVASLLEAATGAEAPAVVLAPVPHENWVAVSQAALPPVSAGRFTVYGSHDRPRIARGPNAIAIDAGEAFGTAHHATTLGCLEAIDRCARTRGIHRALDLGCGSGVLAIALARAAPKAVIIATDIDPVAIEVARANTRNNGVAGRIRLAVAAGLDHPLLRSGGFDLIVANILAGPLVELAPKIARAALAGGTVMLSGLLAAQAAQVCAAYTSSGFSTLAHRRIAGWSTLELVRCRTGGAGPRRRPRRAV